MEHIIYSCEILRSNCHRTRICDFEFGILESVAAAVGPMRAQAAQVTEPSNDLPPSPAGNRSDRARMPCRSTGQARPGTPESLSSRPGSRARERRSEAWNGEAGRRPPALGRREPVVSARLVRFRGEPFPPDRWTPFPCAAMRRTRTEHLSL